MVLFIVPVLTRLVGLPYGEYATPSVVFQTITELSSRIFGVDVGSSDNTSSNNSTLSPNFTDL